MAETKNYHLQGIDIYTNPFLKKSGQAIGALNVTSDPYGAKTKRSGYISYLGTPDVAQVNSLFSWTKDDGSLYTYRASGSVLYYSTQGTGTWTVCGNGTISNGAHVGYGIQDNTLIVGDGVGSTRHTTSGTAFTNTNLAPISSDFTIFQNRAYAGGTASTMFYSTTNDITNWNLGGTSDSSSFQIPGAGRNLKSFKSGDRLIATKTSGEMYKWDGDSLSDMATTQGPTSPYSVAQKETFFFYLNRDGIQGYGGVRPELLSNPIQKYIYNNSGSAVAGTVFDNAPACTHRYDYFLSVGTITDDFTGDTINDCVIKYDYQKNEYLAWKFYHRPTAMHSYKDLNGRQQMIFGDVNGQCYQLAGTARTDAGFPIECYIKYIDDLNEPDSDKMWRWWKGFFSPGCNAQIQVSIGNTYRRDAKRLLDITDVTDGFIEKRIESSDARGKMLFTTIHESSKEAPFTFYGYALDAEVEKRK